MAAVTLACLAVGVLAVACGSSESAPKPEFVPAGEVIQRFDSQTGRQLKRTVVPDPAWDQLGLGLNPSQAEVKRYGIFSVYVAKPGHVSSLGSLLKDKATKKPLARGANGVYWELDSQSRTWVAYKRYAQNVVLIWFSGAKTHALDARWVRLDNVFSGLPG
jgi:hypothetical protein